MYQTVSEAVYKEYFPSSLFGAAGDAPQGLLSQD
jgi:hypothetical protein